VAVAERFGWSAMANLTPYCHKLWFTAILQLKFEINFSYKSVEDLGWTKHVEIESSLP